MAKRERTREDRLFSAAVLRRTFELRGGEHQAAFRFVYDGVLRDLGLDDGEVTGYLAEHASEVDSALGRGPKG